MLHQLIANLKAAALRYYAAAPADHRLLAQVALRTAIRELDDYAYGRGEIMRYERWAAARR